MFKSLKEFFQTQFEASESGHAQAEEKEHVIKLATAALLIEISRSDSVIQSVEQDAIESMVQNEFDLTAEEARKIIQLADNKVEDSISLYDFTRILNDHLSREERSHIVELLWHVAFADSVLDKYEEYYVRKIADLLYVSQQDYIKAKHKALENS